MVCLVKRLVVSAIVVFSCSAAAAITFFLAPFWGLALLGVPIFLGVYLCITAFTGDPEMSSFALCLNRKKARKDDSPSPPDQYQVETPSDAPSPV